MTNDKRLIKIVT